MMDLLELFWPSGLCIALSALILQGSIFFLILFFLAKN